MPIYAYRCDTCGFAKDALQKISDPVLTECPSCSKSTFKKQLTAAGFQLKGTGWYVTDFRSGAATSASAASATADNPAKEKSPASSKAGSAASTEPAASSAASSTDTSTTA